MGSTAEVERVVRAVEEADGGPVDWRLLHPDKHITRSAARRWVLRRVQGVRAGLGVMTTLLPRVPSHTGARVAAFREALGTREVLLAVRALAARQLDSVSAPIGFQRRKPDGKGGGRDP